MTTKRPAGPIAKRSSPQDVYRQRRGLKIDAIRDELDKWIQQYERHGTYGIVIDAMLELAMERLLPHGEENIHLSISAALRRVLARNRKVQ